MLLGRTLSSRVLEAHKRWRMSAVVIMIWAISRRIKAFRNVLPVKTPQPHATTVVPYLRPKPPAQSRPLRALWWAMVSTSQRTDAVTSAVLALILEVVGAVAQPMLWLKSPSQDLETRWWQPLPVKWPPHKRSSTSPLTITRALTRKWEGCTRAEALISHSHRRRSTRILWTWHVRARIQWRGNDRSQLSTVEKRQKTLQPCPKRDEARADRRRGKQQRERLQNRNLKICRTKSQTKDSQNLRRCTRNWPRLRPKRLTRSDCILSLLLLF